jgi:GNAT superfamily N-acetyltransferase
VLRPASPLDSDDAARLWNQQLGTEFPLREQVLALTVFDDPTFRAGDAVAAVDAERLVGFAWRKHSSQASRGFIGGIVVESDHQRRGIGTMLLERLERGFERIEVSGGLLHLLPGIPSSAREGRAFFEARGYALDADGYVDLAHDLASYESPRGLPAAAVRVGGSEDSGVLLAFLSREFPGTWERHARWHLEHVGNVRDFVVLEVDGTLEGFCHIYRPHAWPPGPSIYWAGALQPPAGGLGPIGVSERLRGSGLGRTLLDAALLELQQSGVRGCAIDWTRLVHFYGAFGFRVWRTYYRASKQLTPP